MTPNPQDSAVALEVELLPCPFCGGGAHFYTVQEGDDEGGRCVVCPQCNASSMLCFPLMDSVDQKLIEHWNRRASQSDGTSGVPDGWKLVPVEPTEEMHAAAVRTIVRCSGNDDFPPRVYRAMLAAAPNQGENHVG